MGLTTLPSKFGSLVISSSFSEGTGRCNEAGDLKMRNTKQKRSRPDIIANARMYFGIAMISYEKEG